MLTLPHTTTKPVEQVLHDMKADLNVREEVGGTAIHYAASNGHTDMLKVMSRQQNLEE